MKPKTLAVLVVILAVLAGAAFFRQAQDTEVSIVEQVGMRALAPEGVEADALDRFVLYTGERSEKKVTLKKQESGEWRVDSYHNSPANETKIDPFIENVLSVDGEFRVTAPDADLKTYGLSEDLGFHIEGYTGNDKVVHVQVGESPNASTVFMRRADSNDVFVTNATLKEDAGLWGDTAGMATSPDWWLDKNVLSLDTENATAIELKYPDKTLRFERVAIEVPAAEIAEGETSEDATDAEPVVTYEWTLASGGIDRALKPDAVDSILKKLESMTATTLVDPAKKPDYRLDPPNFVATISREGEEDFVVHGGRPDPRRGTYIALPDSEDDIVYNVSRWDFQAIFPFGETLYDLAADTLDAELVSRIAMRIGDETTLVERDSDAWTLVEPASTLSADPYKPRDIAIAASALTVKDFAPDATGLGFEPALAETTFTLEDGSTYTVQRGISHGSVDGHYARVPGLDFPVAIESAQLDKLFAGLAGMTDLTVLSGVLDTAITGISADGSKGTYALIDNEMFWSATAGAETFNADFDALDDYRYALTVMEATDVRLDEEYAAPEDADTIVLTLDDESTVTLRFVAADSGYTLTASNHPGLVFTVASSSADRALVDVEHFRPEPVTADETPVVPVSPETHDEHDGHNH